MTSRRGSGGGLASVLQTYVINVDATALVESPDYESIVIVDANADLSGADFAGSSQRRLLL